VSKIDIDGQPEIAICPSKPEVYDRYHYNPDSKPGVFDQGELAENVNK